MCFSIGSNPYKIPVMCIFVTVKISDGKFQSERIFANRAPFLLSPQVGVMKCPFLFAPIVKKRKGNLMDGGAGYELLEMGVPRDDLQKHSLYILRSVFFLLCPRGVTQLAFPFKEAHKDIDGELAEKFTA